MQPPAWDAPLRLPVRLLRETCATQGPREARDESSGWRGRVTWAGIIAQCRVKRRPDGNFLIQIKTGRRGSLLARYFYNAQFVSAGPAPWPTHLPESASRSAAARRAA